MNCLCCILISILTISTAQKVENVIVRPIFSGNLWRSSQLVNMPPADAFIFEWTTVPPEVKFVIVQAHAQFARLMMRSTDHVSGGDCVNASNGALAITDLTSGAVAYVSSMEKKNIMALIVFIGYLNGAPLPGGCNMEFEPEVAPFIRLTYDRVQTTAEFQRASITLDNLSSADAPVGAILSSIPQCDIAFTILQYDVYFMVIGDGTLNLQEYFKAVDAMSDVSTIRASGIKVSSASTSLPVTRIQFSSYPGVGVVYNVIVRDVRNGTDAVAAYAPTVTYACDMDSGDCTLVVHSFGWLFCVTCGIIGTFLCLAGHRYVMFEMFIFGFLAASAITFVLVTRFSQFEYSGRTSVTMIFGVVGGCVWILVWWFYGSQVISVLLPGLVFGFLLSCIIFYTPFQDLAVFQDELSFWMTFSCFVLVPPLLLLAFPKILSIVSCAFVGSYGYVVAVDRYLGSGMTAIVISVIKRAVVPHVSKMTAITTFKKNEEILTTFWALGIILGIAIQLILTRNRPAFSVSSYIYQRRYGKITEAEAEPTERTPLLTA